MLTSTHFVVDLIGNIIACTIYTPSVVFIAPITVKLWTGGGGGGVGRPPSLSTLEGNESPVSMIAGPYLLSGGPNSAHPSQGSPVYRQGLLLDVLFSPLHGKLPLRPFKKKKPTTTKKKTLMLFALNLMTFYGITLFSLNQTLPLVTLI